MLHFLCARLSSFFISDLALKPSGIVVYQVLEPQYGMYVWPCAVVLAQYLWTQKEQLRGRTVLEVRRPSRIRFQPFDPV